MSFKFVYSDSCDVMNIVEAINDELKKEGYPIHFEFDNQEHDGFEIVTLVKNETKLKTFKSNDRFNIPNRGTIFSVEILNKEDVPVVNEEIMIDDVKYVVKGIECFIKPISIDPPMKSNNFGILV